jgi:hypothetical protein
LLSACQGGCHRLSAREKQLIGTWRALPHEPAVTLVLSSDRRFTVDTSDNPVDVSRMAGSWRVDGDFLVSRIVREIDRPVPPRERRQKLINIASDSLEMTDPDSSDATIAYERVR